MHSRRCTHAVQYEQIVCRLCPNRHIMWPQPLPMLHTDNNSATSCEECNCRTFTQCTFPFCQEQSRTLFLVQGRQGGILFLTELMWKSATIWHLNKHCRCGKTDYCLFKLSLSTPICIKSKSQLFFFIFICNY